MRACVRACVCVCVFNCVLDFIAPVVSHCYLFLKKSFPLQSLSGFICVVIILLIIFIFTDAIFVHSLL